MQARLRTYRRHDVVTPLYNNLLNAYVPRTGKFLLYIKGNLGLYHPVATGLHFC